MTRDEENRAFGLLRQHGLRRHDRDLIAQFTPHLGLPDPALVAACRRQRPDLFVPDVHHSTEAELRHAMRDMRVKQAMRGNGTPITSKAMT